MFTTSLFKKTLALMVMMYASMSFAAGEANTAADKSVAKSPVKAEKGITQPGLGNKTATKSKSNINNNKTGATATEAPSAEKK